MNIPKAIIALFALVFALAACGTSVQVPNNVTETARVNIQIVSSLADSQSIDRLRVTSKDGEILYSVSDFVGRLHEVELALGETYIVSAKARVSDHGPGGGTVSLSTKVALVATTQDVVLDLRAGLTPWFEEAEDRSSVFLGVAQNEYGGSHAPDLTFTGGTYTSYTVLPIDAVYAHFGQGALESSDYSVTLTSEMFGEPSFGYVSVEVQYPGVPPVSCTSSFGVFVLRWEDGSSRLERQHEVSIYCKG